MEVQVQQLVHRVRHLLPGRGRAQQPGARQVPHLRQDGVVVVDLLLYSASSPSWDHHQLSGRLPRGKKDHLGRAIHTSVDGGVRG